jgi:hypothetical protein
VTDRMGREIRLASRPKGLPTAANFTPAQIKYSRCEIGRCWFATCSCQWIPMLVACGIRLPRAQRPRWGFASIRSNGPSSAVSSSRWQAGMKSGHFTTLRRMPQGKILRIVVAVDATVVWSADAWASTNKTDVTPVRGMDLWFVDHPTEGYSNRSVIEFTFFWKGTVRWEVQSNSVSLR